MKTIDGIDHLVILVEDLEAAAQIFGQLGFNLSPRGQHSDHMGTANYTIMLQTTYLELMGVTKKTDVSAKWLERLETGQGIWVTAMKTSNAAALADELTGIGLRSIGPLSFERPVELPDGAKGKAAFQVTQLDDPGTARDGLFACEHLTPETVWIPSLMKHPNGTIDLIKVEAIASNPEERARELAALFSAEISTAASGAYCFDTNGVEICVEKGETGGWPVRFVGATLKVARINDTRTALHRFSFDEDARGLHIGEEFACGVRLTFSEGGDEIDG